jgi:hypothetical protein
VNWDRKNRVNTFFDINVVATRNSLEFSTILLHNLAKHFARNRSYRDSSTNRFSGSIFPRSLATSNQP